MAEKQLNLVLTGKTGHGKSATGNTILNRRVFKSASWVESETKEVNCSFSLFGDYTLLVVDEPGLEDTYLDRVEDTVAAVKNMDKALATCNGGVDAFLLVTMFGSRFTKEDKDAIDALKIIFGDEFIKHVIIIVTCGDYFEGALEGMGTPEKTFHEWCWEQEGYFRTLCVDCMGRCVLLNNREEDEGRKQAQIQKVVQLAQGLQRERGRYTNQYFEAAKNERDRYILRLKADMLHEVFQENTSLLVAEVENLSTKASNDINGQVRGRVRDLKDVIDQREQGHGDVRELRKKLTQVEQRLDVVELSLSRVKEETIALRKLAQSPF